MSDMGEIQDLSGPERLSVGSSYFSLDASNAFKNLALASKFYPVKGLCTDMFTYSLSEDNKILKADFTLPERERVLVDCMILMVRNTCDNFIFRNEKMEYYFHRTILNDEKYMISVVFELKSSDSSDDSEI